MVGEQQVVDAPESLIHVGGARSPQERLCHGRVPGEIQVGGMGTGRVGCSRWMTLSA